MGVRFGPNIRISGSTGSYVGGAGRPHPFGGCPPTPRLSHDCQASSDGSRPDSRRWAPFLQHSQRRLRSPFTPSSAAARPCRAASARCLLARATSPSASSSPAAARWTLAARRCARAERRKASVPRACSTRTASSAAATSAGEAGTPACRRSSRSPNCSVRSRAVQRAHLPLAELRLQPFSEYPAGRQLHTFR
jgi:hypothetical protein